MPAASDFEHAFAQFRAGELGAATQLAVAAWIKSPDARTATLLALIAEREARLDDASAWLRRASDLDPRNASIAHQLGTTLSALDRHTEAEAAWRRALALAPERGATWLALGQSLLARSDDGADILAGLTALRKAARFEATHDAAAAAFVDGIRHVPLPGAMAHVDEADTGRSDKLLSVVMCTVDRRRAERAVASYAAALAPVAHEIVVVDAPSSLGAGYAEGLRRSRGDVVVFAHDDTEIVVEGFEPRLRAHLGRCDVVGIAGATDVRGPAWAQAGHPFLHGAVGYATGDRFEAHVYSTSGPLVLDAKVLDGVLIAMRRGVASQVGWEASAWAGFHGYDIDFCLRARKAGLRLGVAADLGVLHHSSGAFDERWEAVARELMRRWPELTQPVSERTFAFAHECGDRRALGNYFRGLRAALDALDRVAA